MFAAVGVLFTACNKETDHNNVKHDHSADIVGTWSCLTENYAEVLIINADGSAVSYGVEDGEYWENVRGTVVTEGGNITMTFEDNDNLTGHFDIIPKQSFSLYEDSGERYTYQYCKNDIADEIIGMWVCTDGHSTVENDMAIITYSEDGKMTMTAPNSIFIPGDFVNQVSDYKVVGDILFKIFPKENTADKISCLASRIVYTPNGTSLGDILIEHQYTPTENGVMELTFSFLRVKQHLDLKGQIYDYSAAYISNAKGKNEDFSMLGYTFNMDNIKGYNFDMMFRTELFCVELNGNLMKQRFRANGEYVEVNIPITVDGNKVVLDMSAANPAFRKVELHMFQDKDNTQLHMYMHTDAFINYFANLEIVTMMVEGKIDPTNATAVEKVFADMEARVESINASFVFKVRE